MSKFLDTGHTLGDATTSVGVEATVSKWRHGSVPDNRWTEDAKQRGLNHGGFAGLAKHHGPAGPPAQQLQLDRPAGHGVHPEDQPAGFSRAFTEGVVARGFSGR